MGIKSVDSSSGSLPPLSPSVPEQPGVKPEPHLADEDTFVRRQSSSPADASRVVALEPRTPGALLRSLVGGPATPPEEMSANVRSLVETVKTRVPLGMPGVVDSWTCDRVWV